MPYTGMTSIVGGLVATASGSALAAEPSAPWWVALAIAGVGGISAAIGAIITYFSNRGKQRVDAAVNLAEEQRIFREHMFQQLGRLEKWSEMQDEKIWKLETDHQVERNLKRNCLTQLTIAQDRVKELETANLNNAAYINKLEERLKTHGDQAKA